MVEGMINLPLVQLGLPFDKGEGITILKQLYAL